MKIGHFRVTLCLCFKTSLRSKLFIVKNEFHLQVDFHANQTHYLNGFARRLVLKHRKRVTRKWPIETNFTGKNNVQILAAFASIFMTHSCDQKMAELIHNNNCVYNGHMIHAKNSSYFRS